MVQLQATVIYALLVGKALGEAILLRLGSCFLVDASGPDSRRRESCEQGRGYVLLHPRQDACPISSGKVGLALRLRDYNTTPERRRWRSADGTLVESGTVHLQWLFASQESIKPPTHIMTADVPADPTELPTDAHSNENAGESGDFVSKALLPILLHEVNNATQLLVGLRALLGLPGGDKMFAKRADDLARTSRTMDDLGFALAVLSTAGGANMLMARRDSRGIAILGELARRSLERSESSAATMEGDAPLTAPSALEGWQLPWAAAALILTAAESGAWSWRWESPGQLHGTGPEGAGIDEDARAFIAARVLGSEITCGPGEVRWDLPVAWIRTANG